MTLRPRYLTSAVTEDLADKMVFVGGPRQVGKTTFALGLLGNGSAEHPAYLNWDDPACRPRIRGGEIPPGERLIVFDEIHKFARWRNLIKGLYDRHSSTRRFLVTGSARLDYYRKGGDSLQGRYHYHRLHPLSLGELSGNPSASDLNTLLRFGGFPEPFLKAEVRHWRRWSRERCARVVQDDLRDLEQVREISLIELLMDALPARVGAPLSIRNLREDLLVAHETTERWVNILERLYFCFRIYPFGAPRIRAVRKESKLYLWDWSVIERPGPRFENLVAAQLLKFCHRLEDTDGFHMELRFLRDTDKREVDFVVIQEKKPLFAVECKTGENAVAPATRYFRARTAIPAFYQVHLGKRDFGDERSDTRVVPFTTFCRELDMP